MKIRVRQFARVFVLLCAASLWAQTSPIQFSVSLDPALSNKPVSGRLIILLSDQKTPAKEIRPDAQDAHVWIAAREVEILAPGESVTVHPDEVAYPTPLSEAPEGDYQVMALLDIDHNAAYRIFTGGDLRSAVIPLKNLKPGAAGTVKLELTERLAERPPLHPPANSEMLDFVSPSLSAFFGRPIHMRGIVVLPPSYASSKERYPTVYFTHGFAANLNVLATAYANNFDKWMRDGSMPEMIYVLLDESCAGGTHEFADSLNNGPWGHALTTELIPHLEQHYRMDAKPSGRFLTGHSSGGWATLWLQVTYPKIFGGTWSTSPDPVDFRDFTGPDLYKNENVYTKPDGSKRPIMRMNGKVVATMEELAKQERVLGEYGGQMASFEWVFSPRGPDGRPLQLFNRDTGEVNPEVAKYWEEHFDISRKLRTNWATLGPELKGKIHIIIGTADTFYLDGAVHLLEQELKKLGSDAKITWLEGRNHFDLYQGGLELKIAKEMYDVARPGNKWAPKSAAAAAGSSAKQ